MIDAVFLLLFAIAFYVFRSDDSAVLLAVSVASVWNALQWGADSFGGYSYAIDSGLFILAAHLVRGKLLSYSLIAASLYNFMTFSAEALLTSSGLSLNTGAINLLGLFYTHYQTIMVAITAAMFASVWRGSINIMDGSKWRDINLRRSLPCEISK